MLSVFLVIQESKTAERCMHVAGYAFVSLWKLITYFYPLLLLCFSTPRYMKGVPIPPSSGSSSSAPAASPKVPLVVTAISPAKAKMVQGS
jgi:hypothetical protein